MYTMRLQVRFVPALSRCDNDHLAVAIGADLSIDCVYVAVKTIMSSNVASIFETG